MNTFTTVNSAEHLVAEAHALVETLDAKQFAAELERDDAVLVDVREQAEREAYGAIPHAVHIPRGILEFCADPALPVHARELDPGRRILIYCARGNRSSLAARTLMAMGFPSVAHLGGGFPSWVQAGGAVDTSPTPAGDWTQFLAKRPA